MEIPLNRRHVCSVLSQGILNGLCVGENDVNYGFTRWFPWCVVSFTSNTGRQPGGCSVLSVLLIGSLCYVQSRDVLYELFTQDGLPLVPLSKHGSVIFFCVLFLGPMTFFRLFLMLKDTFANCWIFFLTLPTSANQITWSNVVDLRIGAGSSG